jgi:hypothetical protein
VLEYFNEFLPSELKTLDVSVQGAFFSEALNACWCFMRLLNQCTLLWGQSYSVGFGAVVNALLEKTP